MFCFKSKKIGYVKKTHGVKGELIVELDFDISKNFTLNKWVFLEYEGTIIPFSIDYYQIIDKKAFIVKFKQLNSIEDSKLFSLSNFYVSNESLLTQKVENNIIGYKLFDKNNNLLGTITDFISIKNNPLVQVIQENKKYLVPINKNLILKRDDQKQNIYLNLSKDELIND